MPDFLANLRDVDLGGQIRQAWDFVETIDPCVGGVVVLVLLVLGHKMASGHRTLYSTGLRLGVLAFLLHFGWGVLRTGNWETPQLTTQASRSALVAGTFLAATWITLPTLNFFYRYIRVALATFLIYCGYALVTADEFSTDILGPIALRGLLVAGLSMVVAWILQPAWDLIVPRFRGAPATPPETEDKKNEEEERLSRRERRRWKQLIMMFTRPASQLLAGPSNESEMRRRRDKARLSAEMTYLMAMPDIAVTFPRDLFEKWMNRYLGDHLPADEVEDNSLQLQMMLTRQQKRQQPTSPSFTLEELNGWFIEEQKKIQAMDLDPQTRQAKLIELQELFISMSQRFMGQPQNIFPMIPRPNLNVLTDPSAKAE